MPFLNRPPQQGEIWLADLNPPVGHEQGGPPRPVLVVSGPQMNEAPYALSLVVPLSTRIKSLPGHLFISTLDSGLRSDSEIMCEHTRSISHRRFRSGVPIARVPLGIVQSVVAQIDQLLES